MDELLKLRYRIDLVDKQILALLSERLAIVEEVGEVKSRKGLAIYDPAREASMLSKRREEAKNIGLNPQLIEDILRRIMRESYSNEGDKGYKRVNSDSGHIVIIGGNGQMGKLFSRLFELSGYTVKILGRNDWDKAEDILTGAILVVVSVPINITKDVIYALPKLDEKCILADFTSIKKEPVAAMMNVHSGTVLGLHPMFGPDVNNLAKQLIVVCEGRKKVDYDWVIEQFKVWGAHLYYTTPEKHDINMTFIQAFRHFTTFSYGLNLMREGVDLKELLELSSPIYRLELIMVGRLFAQDPHLYADIILSSNDNIEALRRYSELLTEYISILSAENKVNLVNSFEDVSKWMGLYAPLFLEESRRLLSQTGDSFSFLP